MLEEIVLALEGPLSPMDCLERLDFCDFSGGCAIRELWDEIAKTVKGVLGKTTLEELARRAEAVKVEARYYI